MRGGPIESEPMPGTLRRLGWFVGLWLAGVVTLGAVALLLRWAIGG